MNVIVFSAKPGDAKPGDLFGKAGGRKQFFIGHAACRRASRTRPESPSS